MSNTTTPTNRKHDEETKNKLVSYIHTSWTQIGANPVASLLSGTWAIFNDFAPTTVKEWGNLSCMSLLLKGIYEFIGITWVWPVKLLHSNVIN